MKTIWPQAFPSDISSAEGCIGFTQLQLGTFMIAQGLISKYNLNAPADQLIIAQLSKELAETILNELEK